MPVRRTTPVWFEDTARDEATVVGDEADVVGDETADAVVLLERILGPPHYLLECFAERTGRIVRRAALTLRVRKVVEPGD